MGKHPNSRPFPGRRITGKIFYPKWGAKNKTEAEKEAAPYKKQGYNVRIVKEKVKGWDKNEILKSMFPSGFSYVVYVFHKSKHPSEF
jgi:hypothetical protein